MEAERLLRLNPAACLVVELLDGTRDLDQVRDILLPLTGDAGWAASRTWIEDALRDGWLTAGPDLGKSPSLSANALTALARTLRDRDHVLAAFICQQRAAELAPDDPRVWYQLGELAHIVGRREDARAAYERYFERHPEDAEIEHLLIALRNAASPDRVSDRCIVQLYERFASFYDRNMSDEIEYQGPVLLEAAIAASLGDRRGLDILDLGCGTGLSGEAMRSRSRHLTGVDLSPSMIERARGRSVYDVLAVSEITAFLRQDAEGRSDLITAWDVLIYFGDLRQVIVPAAGRLTPGGLIAFTVERADVYPFALTDSGRFTHHRDHVTEVAADAGLAVVSLTDAVLRHEYGNPVPGLVAVLGA